MFKLLPDSLKLPVVGGVGAVCAFLVFTALNHFLWIPAAEQRGRDLEGADLTAATTKAIGELSNAADQARVSRRLCRERGRVYINATGECLQRDPVVNR
jgi:hypothetical protein